MKTLRRVLYILLQCTWGFPQTLLGLTVFLCNLRRRHFLYHGAVVTEGDFPWSASFGLFLFVTTRPMRDKRHKGRIPCFQMARCLLVHEYGHTIQSLLFGPLYLMVMGIPSAAWGFLPCFRRKRQRGAAYSDFFTERWANLLGEWVTGEKSMQGAVI